MKKEMKELCIEGVATHDDPESCAGVRKGAGEALTGARAGRAIEPRNEVGPGRPRRWNDGRQHRPWRYARVTAGSRAVGEPEHVRNLRAREPGGPTTARSDDRRAGRSGKAEAASLR